MPPQGSPVFAIKRWVMERTEILAVNLESHHLSILSLLAGVVVALSILEDVVLLVAVEAEVHMLVLAALAKVGKLDVHQFFIGIKYACLQS